MYWVNVFIDLFILTTLDGGGRLSNMMIILVALSMMMSGCLVTPAGQWDGSTFRHSYVIQKIAQQHVPRTGPWYFVAAEYNLPHTFRFRSQGQCEQYREMIRPVIGTHSLGHCTQGDPLFPKSYEVHP